MSLISVFYIGAEQKIIERLRAEDHRALEEDSHVTVVDFSGGLLKPVLFPDDVGRLVGSHTATSQEAETRFMELVERHILGREDGTAEDGAYLLSTVGIQRLSQLSEASLVAFSNAWKEERRRELGRSRRSNSLWRDRRFWAFMAGGSGGLLVGALRPPRFFPLVLLGIFVVVGFLFGWWLERGRLARMRRRGEVSTVDWTPQLKALQDELRSAVSSGRAVIYYWSL